MAANERQFGIFFKYYPRAIIDRVAGRDAPGVSGRRNPVALFAMGEIVSDFVHQLGCIAEHGALAAFLEILGGLGGSNMQHEAA